MASVHVVIKKDGFDQIVINKKLNDSSLLSNLIQDLSESVNDIISENIPQEEEDEEGESLFKDKEEKEEKQAEEIKRTYPKKVKRSGLKWVDVGNGRISLRGKPGRKFFYGLNNEECSRIVTLLSEREGAEAIGELTKKANIKWSWIPLQNADYPDEKHHSLLVSSFPSLSSCLDDGESILFHCAAGIHRTGMVCYGLLRWKGYPESEARELISQMREHTIKGMKDRHFQWGNQFPNI